MGAAFVDFPAFPSMTHVALCVQSFNVILRHRKSYINSCNQCYCSRTPKKQSKTRNKTPGGLPDGFKHILIDGGNILEAVTSSPQSGTALVCVYITDFITLLMETGMMMPLISDWKLSEGLLMLKDREALDIWRCEVREQEVHVALTSCFHISPYHPNRDFPICL